jgi:acetyl-CoA carboxylase beta subunit|tara:strand:- start:1698 stop:1943 length:246 start_codon:yes stop_codon:yes gene_type:complete
MKQETKYERKLNDDLSKCLECGKFEYIDRDLQLCMGCINNFDLDELWRLHDLNELDALDFNERKSIRERFRLKENVRRNKE